MTARRANDPPGLLERIRWGNVGRLAGVIGVAALLVLGSRGGAPPEPPLRVEASPSPAALPDADVNREREVSRRRDRVRERPGRSAGRGDRARRRGDRRPRGRELAAAPPTEPEAADSSQASAPVAPPPPGPSAPAGGHGGRGARPAAPSRSGASPAPAPRPQPSTSAPDPEVSPARPDRGPTGSPPEFL